MQKSVRKQGELGVKSGWKRVLKSNLFFALYAVLFLVLIWVLAHFFAKNSIVVPAPWDAFCALGSLLKDGVFWSGFANTLLRCLIVFVFSFVIGAVLALFSYLYPLFGKFCAPIVSFFRSLPTLAITLLIVLWTTPNTAPTVVACVAITPMVYAYMYSALKGVDGELLEMCSVYGVSKKRKIFSLYLPSVSVEIARQSASAFSFGLKIVVAAEILSSTSVFAGLGGILEEATYYDPARLFACVIVVFLTGVLIEFIGFAIADFLEKKYA